MFDNITYTVENHRGQDYLYFITRYQWGCSSNIGTGVNPKIYSYRLMSWSANNLCHIMYTNDIREIRAKAGAGPLIGTDPVQYRCDSDERNQLSKIIYGVQSRQIPPRGEVIGKNWYPLPVDELSRNQILAVNERFRLLDREPKAIKSIQDVIEAQVIGRPQPQRIR